MGHEHDDPGGTQRFRRDDDVVSYETFAEARAGSDAVAVLFGDYGGTIYLTAPMSVVRCTEDQLVTLHSDLDAIAWMGGDAFEAAVAYERHQVPARLAGGDGGAEVIDGVWVHPGLDREIAALAREVVSGTRDRLPAAALTGRRAARLAELQRRRQQPDTAQWLLEQGLTWDYDVEEPVVAFPEH